MINSNEDDDESERNGTIILFSDVNGHEEQSRERSAVRAQRSLSASYKSTNEMVSGLFSNFTISTLLICLHSLKEKIFFLFYELKRYMNGKKNTRNHAFCLDPIAFAVLSSPKLVFCTYHEGTVNDNVHSASGRTNFHGTSTVAVGYIGKSKHLKKE